MNNSSLEDFYITSDTFFGRQQILDIANRTKFSSLSEMESALVKNWNKTVGKDDVVFHLGNFAWDPLTARKILRKLNGNILFMLGHCDDAIVEVVNEFKNIDLLEDQIIKIDKHDLILCHYPLEVWPGKEQGVTHIHGHTVYSHQTDLRVQKRVNICTDFWGYSPVKISTIKDIINEAT